MPAIPDDSNKSLRNIDIQERKMKQNQAGMHLILVT